eukprot:1160084-Pelagomonas_calceolata.AAC.6
MTLSMGSRVHAAPAGKPAASSACQGCSREARCHIAQSMMYLDSFRHQAYQSLVSQGWKGQSLPDCQTAVLWVGKGQLPPVPSSLPGLKKRKGKTTQAAITLPTSIKEKRIPRAEAPFIPFTKKKGIWRFSAIIGAARRQLHHAGAGDPLPEAFPLVEEIEKAIVLPKHHELTRNAFLLHCWQAAFEFFLLLSPAVYQLA